jgi:unsaturated chondroitin disaccharide hydrolase
MNTGTSKDKTMRFKNIILYLFLPALLSFSLLTLSHRLEAQDFDQLVNVSLSYSKSRLQVFLSGQSGPGNYPYETNLYDFSWETRDRQGWASGYFTGSLWLIYYYYEDEWWENVARQWTDDMSRFSAGEIPDIGGGIFYSSGFGHRLTGDTTYIQVLTEACDIMEGFYSDRVGAIQCFESFWSQYNHALVTDFLLSMELFLYTYELTGNERYLDIALHHIQKTLDYNMRDDGSFYHVSDFDDSGELTGFNQGYIQGYNLHPDSLEYGTWSRAQAWAVRALPVIYRYTGDTIHLNAAEKAADYVIDHFPVKVYGDDDYVPYSDYFPGRYREGNGKDASAASIACAGLYDLAALTAEAKYKDAADSILVNLCTEYITKNDPDNYASILKRTMHSYGAPERGHVFGDYFFIESLLLAKGYEIYEPVRAPEGVPVPGTDRVIFWPDPAEDILFIHLPGSCESRMLVVYNVTGQVVMRKEVPCGRISVDVSSLPSGMYIFSVSDRMSGKFLKQ